MNYKDYEITMVENPNSWNGIKSVKARKNFDGDSFDYFYLNGVPLGNGRFEPFLNQDEAEKTVREFIDRRTEEEIINEHYHILIKWNKKLESVLAASQKAFELDNIDEALNLVDTIGVIRINLDEHWRKSLLGHLVRYKEASGKN